jgi:putative ATPase
MRSMGYGKGYKYAHDFDEHYVEQEHRPERIAGHRYYEPGALGYEAKIKEWLEKRESR